MRNRTDGRINAVKLVIGLLYPESEPELLSRTVRRLESTFGGVDRESLSYPFVHTDYYKGIAADLSRRFFTFAGLRHPFGLVVWKRLAISIEAESASGGDGRALNIDPGYIDGARLVLASTKDNAQRIYLWDDIYAEVTLCHRKSGWESFSYTFPDFASGAYNEFLDSARADWQSEFKTLRKNLLSIESI